MEKPAVSIYLTKLPFIFLHWWFIEAPLTLLKILRFIFGVILAAEAVVFIGWLALPFIVFICLYGAIFA